MVSLVRVPEVVGLNFNDLFLHCVAYGLLMWGFMQAHESVNRLVLMGACAGWGVLLEVAQSFTPYRTFELADMLANAAGAVLGWGVGRIHRPVLQILFRSRVTGGRSLL